jgi:hypothetical protein
MEESQKTSREKLEELLANPPAVMPQGEGQPAGPAYPALNPEVLAKLEAMAAQENERNQIRELSNIGSSVAEQATGLQRGNRLSLDTTVQDKLKGLLAESAMPLGATGGSRGNPALDIWKAKVGVGKQDVYLDKMKGLSDSKQKSIAERQDKGIEASEKKHKDNLEFKKNKFKWDKSEKSEKKLRDEVDKFNKDKVVESADKMLAGADSLENMLKDPNPIMSAAIYRAAARASGEVGTMTDRDVAVFESSRAIDDKLAQIFETYVVSGNIDPENQRYLTELAQMLKRNATINRERRAAERAGQLGFGELDSKILYDRFMAPKYEPEGSEGAGQQPKKWEDENFYYIETPDGKTMKKAKRK